MRIFTLNERDNPDLPDAQVREDFAKARRLMGGTRVIGGLQEIGDLKDHVNLRTQFKGYTEIEPAQATPQVYTGRQFKVVVTKYFLAHNGKAGRSPHRGYQVTRFRFKLRPWIKPFIVINTHMVSHPEKDDWGQQKWDQHWAMMVEAVKTAHSNGLDVFVTGDFNKVKLPSIHPAQKILNQHGLDHILFVPAPGKEGNNVLVVDRGYFNRGFHTDHPLVWVDVKVSKK